jgi:hypothetical protein
MRPALGKAADVAAFLLVGVVAAWFAYPALFSTYTEGFQPQIVLGADALRAGDLGLADTVYPFNGHFFLLTRLGTSLGVMGLLDAGMTGLAAFRLIGLVSLVLLVGTLLLLLWRVYRVGPTLGLLCCVLFPPVFEAAYLPNDDLPSAALVCIALLVFWTRPTVARTVLTAVLLGFAALLRLDAVLIAPAFAILLLSEVRGWAARAVRAVIAAAIVPAIPILAYRLCGLSFLDTFGAIARARELWASPNPALLSDLRTAALGITAFGAVAWALGVIAFARGRRWRDLALGVLVPLVYVAAYQAQLVEGRYLLPLAPFLLLTMAAGLRSLASLRGLSRPVAFAALAAALAVWLVPPQNLFVKLLGDADGPRVAVGRAWNPLLVRWWQTRLAAGQAAIAARLADATTRPDPVVVTGGWSSDRLTTLLLIEQGFALRPDVTAPACRGIAETLVRGDVAVLHIRTHIPFVLNHSDLLTWQSAGAACLAAARPAAREVTLIGSGPLDGPMATLAGPDVAFSAAHAGAPPMVPRIATLLMGWTVADMPVDGVSAALDEPLTPSAREAAADVLTRRGDLLR